MFNWLKRILVSVLVLALSATPVLALDQEQVGREPSTAEVLADVGAARPLGLLGVIIGAGAWVIALPFTLPSGSVDRATEQLINKPIRYTFKRPIGQLDSCETLPDSCK